MAKQSTRAIAEWLFQKSIWEILDPVKDKPTAAEAQIALLPLLKGRVVFSVPVLINIVKKGVESKEITMDSPFVKWVPPEDFAPKPVKQVKVKEEKKEEEKPVEKKSGSGVVVKYTCSECGATHKNGVNLDTDMLILLKGTRCTSCNKFGTMKAEFVYGGKTYRKAVKELPMIGNSTVTAEVFVDEHGKTIEI